MTEMWENPHVKILKSDDRGRVMLPGEKGGTAFAYTNNGNGSLTLTVIKAVGPDKPAKVTFKKEGRFTVGVVNRPMDEEAIKRALSEFP